VYVMVSRMLSETFMSLIPGASHWPKFIRNESPQFEARFVQVEVQKSDSIFTGWKLEGSRMPIAGRGEGSNRIP